jgi:hypothetical protein
VGISNSEETMFKSFIKWVYKSLGLRKYDIRDERPNPVAVVEKDVEGVAEEHYLLTSKAKAKKPAAKKPASKKSKVAPKITATKGKQKVK